MRMRPLFLLLIAFTIIACEENQAMQDTQIAAFEPTQGLILVKQGTLSQIEAAIRDYDGLIEPVTAGNFPIEIHPQPDGSFAILPTLGLPSFDMVNMTVWLDAPPEQEDTGDAVAWATSPGDGVAYYFEPERENSWGDTMIGATISGGSVRVTAPETHLSPAEHHVTYRARPNVVMSVTPLTLVVTLDKDAEFGNPLLLLESKQAIED